MVNVLVTGGAGFMGSHFVEQLFISHPDCQIAVVDALTYAGSIGNIPAEILSSPRFRFWHGDVRNAELMDRLVADADVVVHFAAETHVARSIYDNYVFFDTDVIGTQRLANAVLKHGVERFIHISSSEVYGTLARDPMDEEHPLAPMSPYAAAKCGADRLVWSYWCTYRDRFPAVIIRPFNNYGSRQSVEKAIPNFALSALLGEPLTVHGGGDATRDWLYVEDCCRGILAAMSVPISNVKGEVINLGSGKETSIAQIARQVIRHFGLDEGQFLRIEDRPGQVSRHKAGTQKARQLLAFTPQVELAEGLEKTLEWYRGNRAWWEGQLWLRSAEIISPRGHLQMK